MARAFNWKRALQAIGQGGGVGLSDFLSGLLQEKKQEVQLRRLKEKYPEAQLTGYRVGDLMFQVPKKEPASLKKRVERAIEKNTLGELSAQTGLSLPELKKVAGIYIAPRGEANVNEMIAAAKLGGYFSQDFLGNRKEFHPIKAVSPEQELLALQNIYDLDPRQYPEAVQAILNRWKKTRRKDWEKFVEASKKDEGVVSDILTQTGLKKRKPKITRDVFLKLLKEGRTPEELLEAFSVEE